MEDVVALWKKSESVVVVELREAHGALERVVADLKLLHRRVIEDRKVLDRRRIESPGSAPAGEYGSAGVGFGSGMVLIGAVADVERGEGGEEEGDDEDEDDYSGRR